MCCNNTIDWLMECACVPVRYRIAREILHDEVLAANLRSELLKLDSIQVIFNNLCGEEARKHVMPEHGAENIFYENAILMGANLGLNGEIPAFRNAADYYIKKLHDLDNVDSYFGQTMGGTVYYRLGQHFPAIIIANLAAWTGIRDDAVMSFLAGSLDEMYNFTILDKAYHRLANVSPVRTDKYETGIHEPSGYDMNRYTGIYVSKDEREKLKGVPAVWRDNRYFIRREFTEHYGFSYPLIYDMFGLSSLYGQNVETDRKIDAVIEYISSDLFHNTIAEGYGTLVESNGRYHAMGWDPKYPGWNEEYPGWNFECPDWSVLSQTERIMTNALQYALVAAHYPAAIRTSWFKTFMAYLENFKTDHGTYCFNKKWLRESHSCAVLGYHMSLGENRKQKKWQEIESTFYMLKIKTTMEETLRLHT